MDQSLDNIEWFAEEIEMPNVPRGTLSKWVDFCVTDMGFTLGDLTYIFTNDDTILDMNNQYLSHDYYTDIITFDYTEDSLVSGDLFISLDTVTSNANKFNTTPLNELYRVIIHGVLHLCGLPDKSELERVNMENHENKYLKALSEDFGVVVEGEYGL